MRTIFTFLNHLRGSLGNLQSSDVRHDCRLTVGSPSGLDAKWKQNPFMRFAAVFALVFVIGVGNVWGQEYETAYTLSCSTSGTNNSYASNCDIAVSGITWNVGGNSQQDPWRYGGNGISNQDRYLYSKTAISDDITKIDIAFGENSESITVNSVKLEVYSTAELAAAHGTGDVSSTTISYSASTTRSVTVPAGKSWQGRYYGITMNLTVSGKKNKYITISSITFYKNKAASCDKKVTLTKGAQTNGTFSLDKSNGSYDNCDNNFVVTVSSISPSSGYTCTGVTATGGNSSVTGPDGSGNYTVTYTKGNNITSTVTANFAMKCATPTFSPEAGTYNTNQSVTITSTAGSTIYYTTDGSTPTTSSSVYSSAISVSVDNTTIKAFAKKAGSSDSEVGTATYRLKCAAPTFSVAAGTYKTTQSVTLSSTTPSAVIHYTTDGSTPTGSSPTYSSAISVSADMTIKAIATKTNYQNSDESSATYKIMDCDWYESFDECDGTQGPNPPSNTWSGFSGSGNLNYDNAGWAINSGGYGGTGAIKAGSSGTAGTATTPTITVDKGATGKVQFKMGPWDSGSAKITLSGAEISSSVTTWQSASTMTSSSWTDYEVSFTTTSTSLQIVFSSTGNRFWLDEVCVKMDPAAYTVTFDANGHGTAPDPITNVAKNATISKPTPDPSATGWTFGGWYKESGCTNAWNWATDQVTSNTTLYAKWTCSNPTSLNISSSGSKYDFCAGESMTLTVSGSNIGTGATYQWSLGGSPISGATSASYTTSMTAAKAGEYTCTVSNGSCSQTTSGFWVRVWQLYIDNGAAGAWQALDFSNTGTGTGNNTTVALTADGAYHFKLKDNNGGWFGLNDKTVTATESNITLNGSGANVNVNAGLGGNYTFAINYTDKNNPKISITYPTANQVAGKKIWFDKSIIDGWNTAGTSNIYYRIGHTTYSQSSNSWTLVPGTDRFYEYTTTAFDGFAAWQIANNYSQDNGSTSIYVVNGGHNITKSIVHQKYVVGNDGVTIVPGSSTGSSDGCTWYAVTKTDGMLTHTATITTPSHGTIHLAYTDINSAAQDKTSTTAGLAHRTKITATATPDPGYELSTFTVTPSGESPQNITSGVTDNHILAKDATFAATFTAKTITITWDKNGGSSVSPASSSYTYNGSTVTLATATHATKVFAGWWTDPSAGTQITEIGTTNKPTADVTYYAHWSDGNTVQFHAGVGSVSPSSLTQATLGGAVGAFPTPTIDCDGWSFAGWKEGSQQAETTTNPEASLYAGGHTGYVPATATVHMYAVWKKNFGGGTGTVTNTFDWEAANSAWSKSSMSNPQSYSDYKHGGSYSGNVTAGGAYIYYLTKLESPLSLDFYYTKTSNNTTSGNYWCVQTSSNGSAWTTRETSLGNNSLTKGTYEQETVDLSSYSNVYVRLLWSNADNSAGGNLDDVTISYTGDIADQWKWTSSADDYGCTPANQVKTPVISPDEEAQTGDVSVTITCATDDATIRYTTDGTDPSSSTGTIYSGAFTVSCSATVKAIAYKATMDDSEIAEQEYTVTVPTPTFSLPAGTYYDANQSVMLSLPTAHTGTVIKYTTNGDDPTSSSATYSSAITVTEGTTTIKAIGYNATCGTSSEIASATYIVRFGTDYTLVTDVDDLNAGDKVVFISSTATQADRVAMSTQKNKNNYGWTNDYSINAGLTTAKIYPAVGAAYTVVPLTLNGSPGAWIFQDEVNESKYLNCSDGGNLTLTSTTNNNNTWTIAIDGSNTATITNVNLSDYSIQYNGSATFSVYSSTQTKVKIYSLPNPEPVIKVEADLSAFSACRGSASDYQSFIVSGKNLDGDIVISGPTGYEFCRTSGGTYTATLELTPVSKTVAKTQVFVRLAAGATTGIKNGNLNAAVSANSLSTNIAVTGSVSTADTYTDQIHNTVVANQCGEYLAPSCPDASAPADESCVETHFKFMGWITEADKNASGVKDDAWYIAHLVTAGTAMTADGTNYYAVWAKEED